MNMRRGQAKSKLARFNNLQISEQMCSLGRAKKLLFVYNAPACAGRVTAGFKPDCYWCGMTKFGAKIQSKI